MRVHSFADQLRADGVDVMIDRYEPYPKEGWPQWMVKQIRGADFVWCVCTRTYRDRFENSKQAEEGKGVRFEGNIITNEIYQRAGEDSKFVPVLLLGADKNDVPTVLQSLTYYTLPEGYEELYARITGQLLSGKPNLGEIRKPNLSAQTRHDPGTQVDAGFRIHETGASYSGKPSNAGSAPKLLLQFEGGGDQPIAYFVIEAFGDDPALNVIFQPWNRTDHCLLFRPDHIPVVQPGKPVRASVHLYLKDDNRLISRPVVEYVGKQTGREISVDLVFEDFHGRRFKRAFALRRQVLSDTLECYPGSLESISD